MTTVDPQKPSVLGPKFHEADPTLLFEQYKLFVEMNDRMAERRQSANSFFFSICAALFAAIAFLFSKDTDAMLRPFRCLVPFAGVPIAFFWGRLIGSYRALGTAKFAVIHEMEESLPFTAYKTEWEILETGKGKQKYRPLTHLEIWVPRCFMVAFVLLFLWALPENGF